MISISLLLWSLPYILPCSHFLRKVTFSLIFGSMQNYLYTLLGLCGIISSGGYYLCTFYFSWSNSPSVLGVNLQISNAFWQLFYTESLICGTMAERGRLLSSELGCDSESPASEHFLNNTPTQRYKAPLCLCACHQSHVRSFQLYSLQLSKNLWRPFFYPSLRTTCFSQGGDHYEVSQSLLTPFPFHQGRQGGRTLLKVSEAPNLRPSLFSTFFGGLIPPSTVLPVLRGAPAPPVSFLALKITSSLGTYILREFSVLWGNVFGKIANDQKDTKSHN